MTAKMNVRRLADWCAAASASIAAKSGFGGKRDTITSSQKPLRRMARWRALTAVDPASAGVSG
jgi:hypothetical protein